MSSRRLSNQARALRLAGVERCRIGEGGVHRVHIHDRVDKTEQVARPMQLGLQIDAEPGKGDRGDIAQVAYSCEREDERAQELDRRD